MNSLVQTSCKNEYPDKLSGLLKEYNLTFDKLYESPESIANFATIIKNRRKQEFCILPFCHTVEAEAMGGDINLGDEIRYEAVEDIIKVNVSYDESLRIKKMLKACEILKANGETVIFTISGPFSILSCLIDITKIFKCWRKNPSSVELLFNHLSQELLILAEKACKSGADYISYADPVATPKILGPKYTESISKLFTFSFLHNLQNICIENTNITVCPQIIVVLNSLNLISDKRKLSKLKKGQIISHCANERCISKHIVELKNSNN